MSLLQALRDSRYRGCTQHECSRAGCAVRVARGKASFTLEGTPVPHALIDCDMPPIDQQAPHCDYVFLASGGGGYAAPIEMTSGSKKLGTVVRQLQFGADLAAEVIQGGGEVRFRAVLVGRLRDLHRLDQPKKLNGRAGRRPIKFRNRRYRVDVIDGAGQQFADILAKAS